MIIRRVSPKRPNRLVKAVAVAMIVAMFSSGQVNARLSDAESEHFRLLCDCPDAVRDETMAQLEAFHDVLTILIPAVTGVAIVDQQIELMLFEERSDYTKHVNSFAPNLAHNGGYYDGKNRRIVAHRRANPLQLQFHEIVHAAMGDVFADPAYQRYAKRGWPVWFDEGFAEYVSSFETHASGLQFGAQHPAHIALLVDAMLRDKMIPLATLLRGRTEDFTGKRMGLWYAASWALTEFILADEQLRGQVAEWINDLKRGQDGLVSFTKRFGSLASLDGRLRARIMKMAARVHPAQQLAPRGRLDAWTAHSGGQWDSQGDIILGRSGDMGSYLTRAVHFRDGFTFSVSASTDPGASFGVVIGRHGVGLYPYHTLISFDAKGVHVSRVKGPDDIEMMSSQRKAWGQTEWRHVEISMSEARLSIKVDQEAVLTLPYATKGMSLVGLHLQNGGARFERPTLGPESRFATGPRMFTPPRPRHRF